MELIPAIDLLGGVVVRLLQGSYDQVTEYHRRPVEIARRWQALGAPRLHIVDLEAAKAGDRRQSAIVASIIEAVTIPCQVAGGIRDEATARALVASGVDRVVMGTALVREPDLASSVLAAVGPEHLVAAVDVRDGHAMGGGWTADAERRPAADMVTRLRDAGVELFAVTAIARDGLMGGPDLELLERSAEHAGGHDRVIASAGVSTLDDVRTLAARGYSGAILGRALYEDRLDLVDALAVAGG
ncbi:MAG: 1-(5-phosphoribosyl)-5-[(5-phosphoribosylamino)methylideneamino] imidazole-4-carboxamide isomerase [Candidatus Limnocylindrales bacterium]